MAPIGSSETIKRVLSTLDGVGKQTVMLGIPHDIVNCEECRNLDAFWTK